MILEVEYNAHKRVMSSISLTKNAAEAYNNSLAREMNYGKVCFLKFFKLLKRIQTFIKDDVTDVFTTPEK